MELFDISQRAMEVALHGLEVRQSVISNNLANVNTPNYHRSDVSFESELRDAIGSGSTGTVLSVEPTVTTDDRDFMRVDGNGVDVDAEAAELAKTQLLFNAVMGVVTKNLSVMSQQITSAR